MANSFPSRLSAKSGRYERLDTGKILAGAFNIYKQHFGPLALFFLLIQLPPLLVVMRYVFILQWTQQPGWPLASELVPPTLDYAEMALWGIGLLVYWLIVFPFMFVVPARLAGLVLLEKPVMLKECIEHARRRWWETQGSYALIGGLIIVLYLIPLFVALLAFVEGMEFGALVATFVLLLVVSLAALYLMFRVIPLDGAIAFDRPRGNFYGRVMSRLVHSFRLTRGAFWYAVGVMLVTWILLTVARYVLTAPLEWLLMLGALWMERGELNVFSLGFSWQPPLWLLSAQIVLRTVGSALTLPFEYLGLGLLYFDLRFRHEGLDLELNLAQQSGSEADPLQMVEEHTTYLAEKRS